MINKNKKVIKSSQIEYKIENFFNSKYQFNKAKSFVI